MRQADPIDDLYLDYAAATPVDSDVLAAMLPYFSEEFYNPSAPYAHARRAKAALEDARATLAHLIGAKPANITLTAGATEADNLAFAAVEGHVVTDAIEHESTLACAQARSSTIVGVSPEGLVDPTAIAAAIRDDTELVSVALANAEIGTVQPVHEIAQVVRGIRMQRLETGNPHPIWLHTDASQAASCLSVNVSSLGCDLMTLSAAKVYGPKQVGLLWAADGVPLKPLVLGGGQENGVRSGTENVAGTVGFAKALGLAIERRTQEARRLKGLRDELEGRICAQIPSAVVSGPRKASLRLPGLLHVSFPGLEARRLVILLDRQGVSVGTGSACAASKMKTSHVLQAIGLDPRAAQGSLRISLGRPTTQRDIERAASIICSTVRSEADRLGIEI
ncbi:MAG: cysteine desulfurase family protein [Coriobacteriales bacterium]|jgi:cysteine desulfurase